MIHCTCEHVRQRSPCQLLLYYALLGRTSLRYSTLVHCTAATPERSTNGATRQTLLHCMITSTQPPPAYLRISLQVLDLARRTTRYLHVYLG
jgi:hypothetical protein